MLDYQIVKPKQSILASHIDHYMYVSGEGHIPSKKILPRPGASLILDFTDSFYCDDESFFKALSGLQDHPFTYKSVTNPTDHLVVQFSPHGLSCFTGIPLSELTNQIIEPGIIFGEDINDLYEQTASVDTLHQRIEFVEAFLFERYTPPAQTDTTIFNLAKKLRNNLNELDFNMIKEQTSLSFRQVERKFKALVGVDMQTYIRICRFDHAKSLLLQNPSLRLTDVGLETGYYDQPHFSNEVKRMTGVSPKQLEPCLET